MTINFFPKIISILLLVYFFQVLKFLLALFLSAYIPIIPFSKMLHYAYDFTLIVFIATQLTDIQVLLYNHFFNMEK